MIMRLVILLLSVSLCWNVCAAASPVPADVTIHWPQWRGPAGHGVAPNSNPPLRWDENTNIKWKTPLPGLGVSTPVVWGNAIFLTTTVETGREALPEIAKLAEEQISDWMRESARRPRKVCDFVVVAVDRTTGAVQWSKTVVTEAPHSATHSDGAWASGSPVTDGQHVYVTFGSQGLYCLDFGGNVKWQKRFGFMRTRNSFGEGATPMLHGDVLLMPWDHEEQSFVVALDKKTGRELWRANRDEPTAWSTPVAAEVNGRTQAIVSASNRVRGYDLATGNVVWECGGMTLNVIPTPIVWGDLAIVTSGFRGAAALAIRLPNARGDVSGNTEVIAWKYERDTPYVPSPLLSENRLYFPKTNEGKLTCLDAQTGKPHYMAQPLEETRRIYASPVAGGGRVYVTGTEGYTHVLRDGTTFELLATNKLNDKFTASGVIVGDQLLLRGNRHLYCLAELK